MTDAQSKLARIRCGEPPRVLDIFAGCGGLSLGFERAGFELASFVEMDIAAAETYNRNFVHAALVPARDARHVEPKEIIANCGDIDVLVGGPPCQAFTRVGRAKLRALAPDVYRSDARADLYRNFLRFVIDTRPVAVLIENVPDSLAYAGRNIPQEIASALEDLGYSAGYTLLNAVHYGVPQARERMFLIAYASELGLKPSFPLPTHRHALSVGYQNLRKGVLRAINRLAYYDANRRPGYVHVPRPSGSDSSLPEAVTTGDALGDLPRLDPTQGIWRNPHLEDPLPYAFPPGIYAAQMREWPGHSTTATVAGNAVRNLPRDHRIFSEMKPGDTYIEARDIAIKLRDAEATATPPGKPHAQNRVVPPYDPDKFTDKWRKLRSDSPAWTLLAHLAKDGYSHIHPDQPRTITVREAARLQSFPDGFTFSGGMNAAFRQIGNAVPPVLAWQLASEILRTLRGGPEPKGKT